MKPTEEQIREFWEWCGFKFEFIQNKYLFYSYPYKDSNQYKGLPPIDLNSLFKRAVPKAREVLGELKFVGLLIRWIANFAFVRLDEKITDPTLALFWALYEVMKGDTQ